MKKLLMATATATIVALGSLGTQQAEAITIFTSRTDWNTAVIGNDTFVEDFESFTSDTEFRTTPVNVGEFTLLQIGKNPRFRNLIEVSPFEFEDNNGTNHASVFTDFGATTVDLTLNTPVFAWGADFFGTDETTGERLNLNLVLDKGGVFSTIPVTVNDGFFGFVTNPVEDIRRVIFVSRNNNSGEDSGGEGFGLDNVTGARSEVPPVPEPSTILSSAMVLGFGAVFKRGYSRRQKKAKYN
ncbi:hypothetical protein A6770_39745 [Nostoc minutum NIES-26]|uniref:PEP-CTERM protein-sorting domain-containing protein n=1 Tax=Nostoc minutum NIES-26 TaxID=1844469 RepID=A0A367RNY8_9NOSO|nr:hypothetical protein A6770_39745 [Nostoc minutum NIES-26]